MEQYRLTKQRKLIMEEMKALTFHPTAEEFYEIIRDKMPGIGLCTIYRNLEKLHALGVIEKIKSSPIRYEGNTKPHNHIKCIRCGRIDDLRAGVSLDQKAVEQTGYKLHAYTVEINGICKKCQEQKTD